MAQITHMAGPEMGRSFKIDSEEILVIGRGSTCGIVLSDDQASRRHCQVFSAGGGYYVYDLKSSNGTKVNGRKVPEAPLRPGDVIEIGAVRLHFEAPEIAAAPPAPVSPRAGAPEKVSMTLVGRAAGDTFLGRTLAGYRMLEKTGLGNLGVSYKAQNEKTGELATVKILPPKLADEDLVKRFARQAAAGKKIDHPNIVRTLGAGREGDIYYIVYEYFEGRPLSELIKENKRLDPAFTLDVMLQIGHALEHAFKQNIVHRDIRPANILVAKDATAKLDNLWLAKHVVGTAFEQQLTATGKTLGSLHYMPPEQIGGSKRVDCRADIYALAASIYEAMTGEVPCKGATVQETIVNIRNKKPESLRTYNKEIPPAVTLPILRALSKNPIERQQNPKELIRELELARKYQVR